MKKKRVYHRIAFEWNETYDSTKTWIELLMRMGYLVYDIAPEGATFSDYVISDQPIKRYAKKQIKE